MRITDVRTVRLAGPDPHGLGEPRTWTILLVRVDTDEGIYGLGEAPDVVGTRAAIEEATPRVLGRDPLAIRPLVTDVLYGGLPPHEPSMSATATPTGPVAWAAAGIEIALLDIAGKALGTPVYNLLGGAYRDSIPIYLDRSAPHTVDDLGAWAELGANAKAEGYDRIKFDIAYTAPDLSPDPWNRTLSNAQIAAITRRLKAVREEVGSDCEIAVDCHMHYNVPTALRLANELAPLDLAWLEDPTPITNPDALADVRAKSPIPICVGEKFIAEQFRTFIAKKACDIIHPDVCYAGGLHETLKIADYADLNYLPLALHNDGCGLGTLAAAHLAAACPNFISLEYHFHDAPWIADVIEQPHPLFQDGAIELSDRPGLGCILNTDVCAKHLAEDEVLF